MVIFHSYVKLPEGIIYDKVFLRSLWFAQKRWESWNWKVWEPPISFSLWMTFQATNLMVAQCRTVLRESAMEPTGNPPTHRRVLLELFAWRLPLRMWALPWFATDHGEAFHSPSGIPKALMSSRNPSVTSSQMSPHVGSITGGITYFFAKLPGLVNIQKAMENHHFFMGKSTISTGPCSTANC